MMKDVQCPNCAEVLPPSAMFCINCGQQVQRPATGVTVTLAAADNARCPHCDTALPTALVPTQPAQRAPTAPVITAPPQPTLRDRWEIDADKLSGAVFMLGLVILFFTGAWWPGIMIVIGISSLLATLPKARYSEAAQTAVWTIGITVLAITGAWWPGILLLIALSGVAEAIRRRA
jgi:Double zinc ribbon